MYLAWRVVVGGVKQFVSKMLAKLDAHGAILQEPMPTSFLEAALLLARHRIGHST